MALVRFVLLSVLMYLVQAKPYAKHYLDMSHNFNHETIYWPLYQEPKFNLNVSEKSLPGGIVKMINGDFMAGEHGGTHMDSPYHFNLDNGMKIGQIPVDNLKTQAVVVDVRDKVATNKDYMVTVDDVRRWEHAHGRIPDDSVLLVCTRWDKYWPDKNKVFGTDNILDVESMHFPGFHADLAKWLVANRKLVGIGIDTVSPDAAPNVHTLPVHVIISEKNWFILENVKGVCDIPQHGATLTMLPMKIELGTGAPVRIIATWGDDALHATDGAMGMLANRFSSFFIVFVTLLYI